MNEHVSNLLSQSAFLAYLDAGTGSYIVQFLIAGLLGVTFAAKNFLRRGLGYLNSRFGRDKEETKSKV